MSITVTSLSVNNKPYIGDVPVAISFSHAIVNWTYVSTSNSIQQSSFELWVGSGSADWGSDDFVADVYRQPFIRSKAVSWSIKQKFFARGQVCYGQIRLKAANGDVSNWFPFAFDVANVPFAYNVIITPSNPDSGDDLRLAAQVNDPNSRLSIRWFRNGVHQTQFDDFDLISKDYIRYLDNWIAEVTPVNAHDHGKSVRSNAVVVTKKPPVVDSLLILPEIATDQDILEASYILLDGETQKTFINDKSKIEWFVNDVLLEDASNSRFVRLAVKAGDKVRYELTPGDGIFYGATQSSPETTIVDADFRIDGLRVDGLSDNISVRSVNPTLEWTVIQPYNRRSRYANVLVGTAPGASNIFSSVIETVDEQFTIPDNVVTRGVDYYVSVAASDSSDVFRNYSYAHFRVAGSLWEERVSNSTGWTIELAVKVSGTDGYQRASIGDGSRFAEFRIYSDNVQLLLGRGETLRYDLDMSSMRNFLLVGKGSSMRVYYLNELILDGSDLFSEPSTERFIEVGSGTDSEVTGFFKRISYTTEGAFDPLVDTATYSDISVQPLIQFSEGAISDISENNGDVIVSVNPTNSTESGKIYRLLETEKPLLVATENADKFALRVNSLSGSPDNRVTFIGHSRGASFFENHQLVSFHSDSVFTAGRKPEFTSWELSSNTPIPAALYTNDGLIIDTTFSNIGRADLMASYVTIPMAAFTMTNPFGSTFTTYFDISIANGFFTVYNRDTLEVLYSYELANHTIQDLVDFFNTEEFGAEFFGLYSEFVTSAGAASLAASSLGAIARFSWDGSTVTFYGTQVIQDPYTLDPYSKTGGGNWYYSHRRPGTPWFDRANNATGWTIDFDLSVEAIEDSDRPSSMNDPGGCGLYINDGKYEETINFMTQEVLIGSSSQSFLIDATGLNKYRIIGQNDELSIYAKKTDDNAYYLLGRSKLSSPSTRQANAGRPSVASDDSGNLFAVWHDDGANGKRQIYFSEFNALSGIWSDPDLIVSDDFSASNPDIAVDSIGNVYVVYESLQSDYTDISVIHRGANGWSEPYFIANDVGDSLAPKIAIDDSDNVHVCWEDHRYPQPEIFYCRRNGVNGQWESSAFGYLDTRITLTPYGSIRPNIVCLGSVVGITWSTYDETGNSIIYMAQHPGVGAFVVTPEQILQYETGETLPNVQPTKQGYTNWYSSGQGSTDFLVSSLEAEKADFSQVCADDKGRFMVVWHQVVSGVYQIFARQISARMTHARDIVQLTYTDVDSKYPRVSFDKSSFNVYTVFERGEIGISEPYDAYLSLSDTEVKTTDPIIMLMRYNNSRQAWESTDDVGFGAVQTWESLAFDWNASDFIWETADSLGGLEVYIKTPGHRLCRRPAVAKRTTGANLHILYESQMVAEANSVLPTTHLFTHVRDAVFDHTWGSVYDLSEHDDPYLSADMDLTGTLPRKEIRFGDFSDTTSARYLINKIRYYVNGRFAPFNIGLVSTATTNMPFANVYQAVCNNRGDAWLGTEKGLLFYNNPINSIYLFNKEEYGIKDRIIYGITFDRNSNMYLATDNGIFVSTDHAYFWKLTGDLPASATAIDSDGRNRIYVGSNTGLYVFDSNPIVSSLKTLSSNAASARTVAVSGVTRYSETDGLASDQVTVIKVDSNDVAWIGTADGLTRLAGGQISSFTMENGLSSNKIADIAIRNSGIRYIATTSGVNKMIGISISKLDFDQLAAPVVVGAPDKIPEASVPTFLHVRSIHWKEPNVLFVATSHSIYQIELVDDAFQTEAIQITNFDSKDFTLTDIVHQQNDELRTFKIIGLQGRTIPKDALYEVILNGKKITRGFTFSADKNLLRFDYPIKESDLIQVNVRFDVQVINDFSQNEAARRAIGKKATRIEKLLSRSGAIFAQTGGDINSIQVNDETSDLPFDRITLDTEPPKGKITIGQQIDQTVFRVNITKLFENNEYVPFDAVSGIDRMAVSNFTNFTSDGDTALVPVPFATSLNHDLGIVFDSVTREFTIPVGKGRRIYRWNRLDGSQRMLIGTGEPARIYMLNPITALWEFKSLLDDGNENSSVEFIVAYQGRIVVGTGSSGGAGKVWVSTDGSTFSLLGALPVAYARCAAELAGVLYIGCGGDEGLLYGYDGNTFSKVFGRISGDVRSLVAVDGELYAGTGREGRIYRLDPINRTQQILDANSDPDILSVGFASVGENNFVFTGSGSTAQIRRSRLPDGAFTHSFKTVNAPVYSMSNVDGTLYAAIGSTVFALENVWTSKFTHSEPVRDIKTGIGDIPWFVSDNYVYKIGALNQIKNVYLKLIDRAGNETQLFLDTLQTQLDPNLYDSVTLSDLSEFSNQNRILEVDSTGNTVFVYDGDDRFYSADKLDQEQGSYYSEIFNGTNSLVSWDRITWDATIPDNTSLKFFIRTGNSRDEVLDAKFDVEIDGADGSGDISFLSGQYLQFKAVMTSKVRGMSPSLRGVVVRSISGQSTHFFTTNFLLPSRLKGGIATTTKMVPIAADIILGVNTNDSTDFAEYQIIDENRIFTTEPRQSGSSLRFGIRLLTPNRGEVLSEEFGEYGPYHSTLFNNSIDWMYKNNSGADDLYQFRVSFYDDVAEMTQVYSLSSLETVSGFSDNGEPFQSTGSLIESGEIKTFSFTPVGATPLLCNTYYFVKVEAKSSAGDWETVFDNKSFIQACGTSFVDNIDFNFVNDSTTRDFNFRIRFFSNPERTQTAYVAYSGNDATNWTYDDGRDFPANGLTITSGGSQRIGFKPDLTKFETGVTYYLSIDSFDGQKFSNNNNSYTFKARSLDSAIYCGPYTDVPVVKNFAVMIELEGNQFVTLKIN